MYYKMIANKPTYEWDRGGDPTFVDGGQQGWTYLDKSYGNQDGEPIASRGWRVKYKCKRCSVVPNHKNIVFII